MKRWILISALITIISGVIGLIAYFSTSHFQLSSEYKKCDSYLQEIKNADKDDIKAQNEAFKRYKDCSTPLTNRYFRNSQIFVYIYLISLPIFFTALISTAVLFHKSEQKEP